MKIKLESKAFSEPMGVVKAHIDEAINQVTMIDLELASKAELRKDDLESCIGQAITLTVEDTIHNSLHKVRWDGFIFEMIDIVTGKDDNGIFYYTLVMRPKLWQLNYSANSRCYPNMSRIEVIDELLKTHGFSEGIHYTKKYYTENVYPIFNQLLQTGNSDLSFFRSLLKNAGINYYYSCADDGTGEEQLHLVDHNAFFSSFDDQICIERSGGMAQKDRRIEEITRLTRAIPKEVTTTAFLADGSTTPAVNSMSVKDSNTQGVVELFIPEGLCNADNTARQAGNVVAQGFAAARVVHQGISDHLRMRPGRRMSLKDNATLQADEILVVKSHHCFEQTVLAATSEEGGGGLSYKNHFMSITPQAAIRPTDNWTDVDTTMDLDCALDIDVEGKPTLSPKFKYSAKQTFNPSNDSAKNTQGINELVATVSMLQAQIRTLRNRVYSLEANQHANGSGLITAEITKNAWVTPGKELVCMVKAEEFEDPIVCKVAVSWHDKGGGMLQLPRAGNHVWIQRVHRSKGNDWVLLGYRPSGTVAASNDPANNFKINVLG